MNKTENRNELAQLMANMEKKKPLKGSFIEEQYKKFISQMIRLGWKYDEVNTYASKNFYPGHYPWVVIGEFTFSFREHDVLIKTKSVKGFVSTYASAFYVMEALVKAYLKGSLANELINRQDPQGLESHLMTEILDDLAQEILTQFDIDISAIKESIR